MDNVTVEFLHNIKKLAFANSCIFYITTFFYIVN